MRTLMSVLVPVWLALLACSALGRDMPIVDPAEPVAKYGRTDRISLTEYADPQAARIWRSLTCGSCRTLKL